MPVEFKAESRDLFFEAGNQIPHPGRTAHTHGIGDPEAVGPGFSGKGGKPVQEIPAGPGGVLGAYGNPVKIGFGRFYQGCEGFQDPGLILVKGFQQDGRHGEADVNPRCAALRRLFNIF